MTETTYKFDLSDIIIKSKNGIKKSQLSAKNINQLVIKIQCIDDVDEKEHLMTELLTLLYINCAIAKKIKRAMSNAYLSYTTNEEFLSLFYLTVQDCIRKYDSTFGDFHNFVSKSVDCAFKNENKSGFLKVTGNVPNNKRKSIYAANIDDYEIGKKNSFQNDTEAIIMNQIMIEKIAKIEDGDILLCKYLNREKPETNKQLANYYELSERQIRSRLKKVARTFRCANPDFYTDYFYDVNNVGDTIAIKTA